MTGAQGRAAWRTYAHAERAEMLGESHMREMLARIERFEREEQRSRVRTLS